MFDCERSQLVQSMRDCITVDTAQAQIRAAASALIRDPLDTQNANDLITLLGSRDTQTARAANRRLLEQTAGAVGDGTVAPLTSTAPRLMAVGS